MRVRILGKLWDLTFTRDGLRQGDAADWTKDEDEWVAPVAADIARALWRLGARWVEE